MRATLYATPGSHAVRSGELMLEHKGIDFRRVNFPPGMHWALVRLRGFPGRRVPAIVVDGRKMQGTRSIARALDEVVPEPRLVPADPDERARMEEAESWGEEVLQPRARRLVAAAGAKDPNDLHDRGDSGRLGYLLARQATLRRLNARGVVRSFGATPEVLRQDRAELPGTLDRVDAWIAEGVLNGPELNAADLQIAPSLALVDYVVELRPQLRGRPLEALLDRVLPEPGPG